MAATKSRPGKRSASLRALTAAALALPGIMPSNAGAADGDEFSFEYHHYAEGERNLDGQSYRDLKLKPLEADSLSLSMRGSITDRLKFGLNYTQDTWSGATPVTTVPHAAITDQIFSGASRPTEYFLDSHGTPVAVNWNTYNGHTVKYVKDAQLVHVMASASPETRRQVDGKMGYEWDDAAVNLGGGFSDEPDFKSYFVNTDGRVDFDNKQTTLSWGASYTLSNIEASLAANTAADWGEYLNKIRIKSGESTLFGSQHNFSANVGLTEVLNKDALLEGSVGFTRDAGYLADPYKAAILAFDDPKQIVDSTGLRTVVIKGALEERPHVRNEWTLDLRYVQYIGDTDAALHGNYRYYRDDWGIDAHTLDLSFYQPLGDDWMLVPGARYYSQSAADFYRPYFLFNQAFPILFPRNPELPPNLDFSQIALHTYSSDERLSAFGTLSASLAIEKQISSGVNVEVGAEFSRHAGSLKFGGGGEQSYANFNSYTIYASLNVNLAGRDGDPRTAGKSGDAFSDWDTIPFTAAPAGVRFAHLLDNAGDLALDFHHDYAIQGGNTLHGSQAASDAVIAALLCGDQTCSRKNSGLYTHSTSLDVLYAPFDGWTVLVSPQFVDKHADEQSLGGGVLPPTGIFNSSGPSLHHSTASLGDTGVYALTSLWTGAIGEIDGGFGFSIPTGSVNRRVNLSQDYLSYDLQTGSGTWDFHPSITYQGSIDRFSWGGQLSAIKPVSGKNEAGYSLGAMAQATVWGAYNIFNWLSASVRGVGTEEGAIEGSFKAHVTPTPNGFKIVNGEPVPVYSYDLEPQTELGPMDLPASYGGRFADVGFGLSAVVGGGAFAGDRLGVEWLTPVKQDVNGYQLRRTGTLSVVWNTQF